MELRVERHWYSRKSTIGQLYVDGVYECFTLEDVVRPAGVKVPGATAIPAGRYQVIIDYSERFGRPMPHILNVPEFTGIRIHPGNTAADTEGCLLVGQNRLTDDITQSRNAFDEFLPKLEVALSQGDVFITYEDAPTTDSPIQPPLQQAQTVDA